MRLKLRCRCANRIRLDQIDKDYYIKTTGYEINRIEQYRLQGSVIENGLFIGIEIDTCMAGVADNRLGL